MTFLKAAHGGALRTFQNRSFPPKKKWTTRVEKETSRSCTSEAVTMFPPVCFSRTRVRSSLCFCAVRVVGAYIET